MELTIRPVGQIYSTEDKEKLEALGFQFDRYGSWGGSESWRRLTDSVHVRMRSLNDLLAFAEKWGDLIIEKDGTIRIYDDYYE